MGGSINMGNVIAERRRAAGVTQEALAAHLGVTKAAVSKWELNQSLPDVALLPRIAAYFSLSLDELFGYRAELTEEESAAVYARLYAEGEKDLAAACDHLRREAAGHYSDARLLVLLASLLTGWADATGAAEAAGDDATGAAEAAGDEGAGAAPAEREGAGVAPGELRAEALGLLDRALEVTTDPALVSHARQAKAAALFPERCDEAVELLEPLVKQQDAASATMLLAACYRRLGRGDDAWELLQSQCLRATSLLASALLQEIGMAEDATYVRAAGEAARAVVSALGLAAVNPAYPPTLSLELADAYLRLGERDLALDELARAVDEVGRLTYARPDVSAAPLFERLAGRLDPARSGAAWAEHKDAQADQLPALLRSNLAEHMEEPAWAALAGDPRYEEARRRARALAG